MNGWQKMEQSIKDNFFLQSVALRYKLGYMLTLKGINKTVFKIVSLGLKYYVKSRSAKLASDLNKHKFRACLKQNHRMKLQIQELKNETG